MKPKKMSLKNFNLVESLQTMSCFAVAACMWSHSEIKEKINKCLIPGSVYFRDDSYIPEMMHYLIRSVEALIVKLHPTLPPSIRSAVQESIRFIGEDIFDWIQVSEKYHKGHIVRIYTWQIHLTPFHTVDRLKSGCLCKNFSITQDSFCECCFKYYIDLKWQCFSHKTKDLYTKLFGKYKYHAIAYWKCYVYTKSENSTFYYDPFDVEGNLFKDDHQFYDKKDTPLENIFKVSVHCGYDHAAMHYWYKLKPKKRERMIKHLLRSEYVLSKLEIWLDRWAHEERTSKSDFRTFCFLWNQMSYANRKKILLHSYSNMLSLILRSAVYPEEYFYRVFDAWKPRFLYQYPHERTLRIAASNVNKSEKHRKIFQQLWCAVPKFYNNSSVVDFVWRFITLYNDIDSAAFIVNKYNENSKHLIVSNVQEVLCEYNLNGKHRKMLKEFFHKVNYPARIPEQEGIQIQIEEEDEDDGSEDESDTSALKKRSVVIVLVILLIYVSIIVFTVLYPKRRDINFHKILHSFSG